jgi:hypothetical protein
LLNNIFLCSNSKLAIAAFFAMKKQLSILLFMLFTAAGSVAQQNNIWCFGDSAGVNFNTMPPSTFISSVKGRGSCTSIADSSGNLLFYAYTRATLFGKTTLVFNYVNQLMEEGDSIVGEGWYNELTIVPNPINSKLYYLFSVGVLDLAIQQGFYYSIIDMSYNGGLGKVVSKNNQLLNNFMVDCVGAVKHGNGRDWWLVCRKGDFYIGGPAHNEYIFYLITPTGVSAPITKSVGSLTSYNLANLIFSPTGNKMIYTNPRGLLELYDFDRCTGDLTLEQTISPENTPYHFYWSSAFSPDESKLYVQTASYPDTTYLIQFDLSAANIAATADTIFLQPSATATGGDLRLASDGKIYISNAYYDGFNFTFPYSDSTYNMYNTYLGVVNYPDSLSAACDYQPYSFYLGGARTYLGLPNNPNYGLGALAGSACDTLTAIAPNPAAIGKEALLNLYYQQEWQKLFVNGHQIKGTNCLLQVFDVSGKLVYSNQIRTTPPYYTHDVNCQSLSKGMYVVTLQTDKEKLQGRFVK